VGIIKKFEDLLVWKKAHELVLKIYEQTRKFPSEEKFGLISQMHRSAVSIAANISEGFKRKSKKDKMNFYNIAQSSLSELKYCVILSKDLGYLGTEKEIEILNKITGEVERMLVGLIKSVKHYT
jgi:four helix bundle protein